MKTLIVLVPIIFLLASCNPFKKTSEISSNDGSTSGGSSGGSGVNSPRLVRVMNYNQYNMTLSKLTGINQSKVSNLFEQLKGSLPADGAIDEMTAFNLVAKTRLADFYCGIYVNGERDGSGVLVPGGVPMIPDPVISNTQGIKAYLLENFLDYNSEDSSFDSLTTEIDNIYLNSDGKGGVLINANLNPLQLNRNLTVMACVTILASSYITLLE